MTATITARTAARLGRLVATVASPYTSRTLTVVAARPAGCHVELVTADGRTLLVDGGTRLRLARRAGRRRRR